MLLQNEVVGIKLSASGVNMGSVFSFHEIICILEHCADIVSTGLTNISSVGRSFFGAPVWFFSLLTTVLSSSPEDNQLALH